MSGVQMLKVEEGEGEGSAECWLGQGGVGR